MKEACVNVKNDRGQMTIEMILLLVVALTVTLSFQRYAKQKEFMKALVEGPWKPMQGMLEDGVWLASPASKAKHPSQLGRHGSYDTTDHL